MIVVEALSAQVYVMGEVTNPGTMPLHGPMTILQALAMAGGFNEWANRKDVRVLRQGAAGMQTIRFNYKDAINGEAKPFYLRPATPSSFGRAKARARAARAGDADDATHDEGRCRRRARYWLAGAARAPEPVSRPGWTFTPSFGFAGTYDDNMSLFGHTGFEQPNNGPTTI